jgi:hypothetical protein
MSWEAMLSGELEFATPAQLKQWRKARVVIAAIAWPMLLAPIDEDIGEDFGVVDDAIKTFTKLEIASVSGAKLVFGGHLPEDDYREILNELLGAVSAAQLAGATGTLRVVDAGTNRGGEVTIDAKRIKPRTLTGKQKR